MNPIRLLGTITGWGFVCIWTFIHSTLFCLAQNEYLEFGGSNQTETILSNFVNTHSSTPPSTTAPSLQLETNSDNEGRNEESGLTLIQLERLALSNNPAVARAAANVEAARGRWIQAGLPPNPNLGYDGQQLGSGGQAEQHGIRLSQEFVRGGKLALSQAVVGREIATLQQEFATQSQRVRTDVQIAFYRVLLAQRTYDLTQSLVEVSQQGAQAAEALFRAQEASRADVLQAQLEVESARILLNNAENRLFAAWQRLATVVGIPNLPLQSLQGDAFTSPRQLDFESVLANIQQTSPEVTRRIFEIERARAVLRRACVEPIPNVTVEAMVNVVDNGIGGSPDGGVAITFPIPVLNRNQGAIRQAQQEIAAAQSSREQLGLELQSRLAETFERYSNASYQVQRYQSVILPTASETLDLVRKIYGAGETNFVSLLLAQRTYFQTNLDYLNAVLDLRVAEAEIDGLLLQDSLTDRTRGLD